MALSSGYLAIGRRKILRNVHSFIHSVYFTSKPAIQIMYIIRSDGVCDTHTISRMKNLKYERGKPWCRIDLVRNKEQGLTRDLHQHGLAWLWVDWG